MLKFKDNFICTDLYTKPTDAHSYLHRSSCHPLHCIMNLPYSQMLRLSRLCSDNVDFEKRVVEMGKNFTSRGYSKISIDKAACRARSQNRTAALKYKTKSKNDRVPFVITHNPMNPPLRNILRDQQDALHRSDTMKAAMPHVPLVGERNCRSLRDILMPSILPRPSLSSPPGSHKCTR